MKQDKMKQKPLSEKKMHVVLWGGEHCCMYEPKDVAEAAQKLKEEITIVKMKDTKVPFALLKQRFIDNFSSCKNMKDLEKELQFILDCCNISEEFDKIMGKFDNHSRTGNSVKDNPQANSNRVPEDLMLFAPNDEPKEDKPLKKDICECGHSIGFHKGNHQAIDKFPQSRFRPCVHKNCSCKNFKPLKEGCGNLYNLSMICGKKYKGKVRLCPACSGDEE